MCQRMGLLDINGSDINVGPEGVRCPSVVGRLGWKVGVGGSGNTLIEAVRGRMG